MKTLISSVLTLSCLIASMNLCAQTFSYDGNRWYEIEVSIFTNQSIDATNQELFLPENIELNYPSPITHLTPLSNFFSTYFTKVKAEQTQKDLFLEAQATAIEPLPTLGPVYLEPNTDFRLIDKDSAAFISLSESEHEFTQFNRNLELNRNHRLLFHAVWRQPVLNKVQATAIAIKGGDDFGLHSELEGSILISYNINRVDIDTQLWRNSFAINSEFDWEIPASPLNEVPMNENGFIESESLASNLVIDQVYPMEETRQMISNQLHYLDHPALGLLIEVRPYELPSIFDFSLD